MKKLLSNLKYLTKKTKAPVLGALVLASMAFAVKSNACNKDCYQDWKNAQVCLPTNCKPCPAPILKATNYTGLFHISPTAAVGATTTALLSPLLINFGLTTPPTLYVPLTYVTDLVGNPTFSLISGPGTISGNLYSVAYSDLNLAISGNVNVSYSVSIGSNTNQGIISFSQAFNFSVVADLDDVLGGVTANNNGLIAAYNAQAASENAILEHKDAQSILCLEKAFQCLTLEQLCEIRKKQKQACTQSEDTKKELKAIKKCVS